MARFIQPPGSDDFSQESTQGYGEKFVDEALCIECGLCEKLCPYKAIYTSKYRGAGHYPKPINQLKEKLKA